jgi:hypothetical protein
MFARYDTSVGSRIDAYTCVHTCGRQCILTRYPVMQREIRLQSRHLQLWRDPLGNTRTEDSILRHEPDANSRSRSHARPQAAAPASVPSTLLGAYANVLAAQPQRAPVVSRGQACLYMT